MNTGEQNQFITMVQTALIVRYSADPGDAGAPLTSPVWVIEHLESAYRFAPMIPKDVTPAEAAEAFVTWVVDQTKLTEDDRTILSILINEKG